MPCVLVYVSYADLTNNVFFFMLFEQSLLINAE